ncbi:MAG: DMT family transporter [Anaerovoracaceae bacterium]|jgi:drug/metabolite transporter (DMT)-like permease
MTQQLRADIMLVLVTLFWGVSYWLIDISLTVMDPFTLNTYRFLIAFFLAVVMTYPNLKNVSRITIKYSAILGVALIFVYIGATFAVRYTSLSNAGFLCALTVVITPILGFVFLKQKLQKKLAIVVLMCLIGIGLLTLNEELKPALGDLLAIMAAVAYAIHLLITESAVKKEGVNAFHLGVFQLGFTGLFNLILALIVEEPKLPSTLDVWGAVLFLSIFCTGLAFIIQTVAQQYTSASHVGIIFSLEPVFAGLVAFILAGEVLAPRGYLGAGLLVASLFIMELEVEKIPVKAINMVKNLTLFKKE